MNLPDRHHVEPYLCRAGCISPQALSHVVLRTAHFEESQRW